MKYRGSICAAKEIHRILFTNVGVAGKEKVIDDFLQECRRCSSIIHKNIVRFYGVYYPPNRPSNIPSLVMELMDKSLIEYIDENQNPKNADWTERVALLSDVANGLSYLHNLSPPIIHRDLSPNNILLKQNPSSENEKWIGKIADLGMAKVVRRHSVGKKIHTPTPGTPPFMPPEATGENPNYTTSLDVFSYGGVMLFVFTHEWPIPADDHNDDSAVEKRKQYLDVIPKEVKELKPLVIHCLNDDKNERPTMKSISKVTT